MTDIDMNNTDNERYAYLIQQINESGLVWLLQASDGMFAMFEDNSTNQYVPIWPDQESAASYSSDDWEGYTTIGMKRPEFLDWLNELDEDQILIGAYPQPDLKAIPMKPLELKEHILDASRRF